MESKDYRSYLVECVKTSGRMIIDMAEDIVGNFDAITDLAIEVHFDQQECLSVPEVTITRMHLPDRETIDHLLDIRVEKLKKNKNVIKLENYEVELEEKYVSEEYETTILFFRGPKEMVIKDYPEAESTEISIEFPTSTPHSEYATVKIYYTKDGLYYDWCDKEFTEDDVEKLIAYGIEKGENHDC